MLLPRVMPAPIPCPHGSTWAQKQTHTQLHAHMYQKHLDTKPESTYMKPEGNGHSQDPSLIDGALNSQGFPEILSFAGWFMGEGSRNSSIERCPWVRAELLQLLCNGKGCSLPGKFPMAMRTQDLKRGRNKQGSAMPETRGHSSRLSSPCELADYLPVNTGTGHGSFSRGHTDSGKHLSHHRLGRCLRGQTLEY